MVPRNKYEGFGKQGLEFTMAMLRGMCQSMCLRMKGTTSRAELRAILTALLNQLPCKTLHIVLDSGYIYKGLIEWAHTWQQPEWMGAAGPVGHRDLWELIITAPLSQ